MNLEKKVNAGIFKSTILFSFVKAITIVSRVIINKFVSIFLGSAGLGIIGLFYSTTDLIKAIFSLGIPQSVVRDVALASSELDQGNQDQFSKIMCISKRIVIFTACIGAVFTVLMSPYLSYFAFGSYKYTISFVFLSLFVFSNMVNDGQIAILRGLRDLKALAKSTLFGVVLGLLLDIPIYYFLREDGILPSLLISSFSSLFFSWWLISKIKRTRIKVSIKETYKGSIDMVALGIALTIIAILGMLSNLAIRIIISKYGSLSQVGVFEAGVVIVTSYFGIVMGALNTDYYPRMFAASNSNEELSKNLNSQLNSALIMLTPLLCIFIFLMQVIIKILYTSNFVGAVDYLKFALFAIIVNIYSDTLGVVLIAKNEKKIIIWIAVLFRIMQVILSFFGFIWYGIFGLGLAALIVSVISLAVTGIIVFRKYNLFYKNETLLNALITLSFIIISMVLFHLNSNLIKILLEVLLFILLMLYSNKKMKALMGINLLGLIKNKFIRKN